MDNNTKKLIEKLKELKSKLEDLAYKNRDAKDNAKEDSYWDGYYSGKAEGMEDAALMLGKTVTEWCYEAIEALGLNN